MRSAEGVMIIVDVVLNTPAATGVKDSQAYWLPKAGAEGTHEIKWFKMWKMKDLILEIWC